MANIFISMASATCVNIFYEATDSTLVENSAKKNAIISQDFFFYVCMTQNLHAFHFPTNEKDPNKRKQVQLEKCNHFTGFPGDLRQPVGHSSCKLRSRRPLTPLWGCGTCCAKVLLGLLQGVLQAAVVQVVYSATTRTRPPTPHPPETAANVKGGWLLLPAFQLLIIIIIN